MPICSPGFKGQVYQASSGPSSGQISIRGLLAVLKGPPLTKLKMLYKLLITKLRNFDDCRNIITQWLFKLHKYVCICKRSHSPVNQSSHIENVRYCSIFDLILRTPDRSNSSFDLWNVLPAQNLTYSTEV